MWNGRWIHFPVKVGSWKKNQKGKRGGGHQYLSWGEPAKNKGGLPEPGQQNVARKAINLVTFVATGKKLGRSREARADGTVGRGF